MITLQGDYGKLNVHVEDSKDDTHNIEIWNKDHRNVVILTTDQLKELSEYLVGKIAELR